MTFDDWWEKNRRAVVINPSYFARLVWRSARKVPISDPKSEQAIGKLERAGYRWNGKQWSKKQ